MQEFEMVKRGYRPEQVEKYISELERTIQEYKDKDSAISKAILNAQVAADNIIRNANAQADDILTDALTHLEYIHNSVKKQKDVVKRLQQEYIDLVNRYLKNVQTTDFLEIFSSISDFENYLVSFFENQTSDITTKIQSTKINKRKEDIRILEDKEAE
ncbi:MAG: DivIVA domain-containing protein [Defluviitaleaceae bacterium]|nr:DivIVA domain-containing protein [Defluviitaleaceae bacterium]